MSASTKIVDILDSLGPVPPELQHIGRRTQMAKAYPAGLRPEERNRIDRAREYLERHDYVVLRQESHQAAQERHHISQHREQLAEERVRQVEFWAQTTLHNEIRELQARCTALYGAARAHGATAEELAAIQWPTTGVVCPTCTEVYPFPRPGTES